MKESNSQDSGNKQSEQPAAITPKAKVKTFSKIGTGYTFKVLLLAALILLLLIPLAMLQSLVHERGRTAQDAENDIMAAWGNQLVEAGPIITIPGERTREIITRTEKNGTWSEQVDVERTAFTLVLTPKQLDINAAFNTEIRRRGIFSVPLFYGELSLVGTFDPDEALSQIAQNETLFMTKATLVIALSSQKGIRKITRAVFNQRELLFRPGNTGNSLTKLTGAGIYAELPPLENSEMAFTVGFEIQGGQAVQFLPVGKDTRVTVSADWASPSFQGAFLPLRSEIGDTFSAQWEISYLSRDIPLSWKNNAQANYDTSLFGVSFFRAIDTYALNTRAVKYAILFLIVPFLTLFLLEIFTKRRIHPVPYLLSGIGNVVFYLLLLSLSEQMAFYTAYLVAALAVTGMMTLYSRALLPSWSKSWYMGLVMTLAYIMLYAVLNAESYALLIGSVGAFVVTALVMFLTRNLDWHGQD
jgi:inner membrane protein